MNRFVLLATFIFCVHQLSSAQWQRVASFNVGNTGKMVTHGSAVFAYGFQGSYQVHRSTDNGGSWTNISSSAAAQFSDIFSFNGMLYACYLGTVYTSANLGGSWSTLSSVTVTGNGALIGFASDGTTLYAFSNRKSVFRSTNNGASWTESLINNAANFTIVDFAARGNRYAAVVAGTGAGSYLSDDAGATWTLQNPPTAASGIYSHGNALLALSFGGGIFRMQDGTSIWAAANTGLPNAGALVLPRSPASQGVVLYVGFQQLVSNIAGVARSTDGGVSWTPLDTTGLPTALLAGSGSTRYVALTPTHVYYYYYSTNAGLVGVYRTAGTSNVREAASGIPHGFSLEQNYPNPFNPTTNIRFQISEVGRVTLSVSDILGRAVATLVNENLNAGSYEATFDARQLPSGVYFYQLRSGGFVETKRMLLLK